MTYPSSGGQPAPEPPRGLPGWARVVLIVLAVLIIGTGICAAIAFGSAAGI